MAARRTWLPDSPSPPAARAPADLRAAVDALASPVVARLKRCYCLRPAGSLLNWPDDVFVRWHRSALYVVVVMRTPHGRPATFETHAARLQYAGDGKFDLAVPMRRGWNTLLRGAAPEQCLQEIAAVVVL